MAPMVVTYTRGLTMGVSNTGGEPMLTRDMVRDTASTLAHLWTGSDTRDRLGVERIIRSHAPELRPVLCAHVMRYLEARGFYTQAAAFEAMLFDIAQVPEHA
jgi:hypothetical protein